MGEPTPLSTLLREHPVKAARLKCAAGLQCEHCQEEHLLASLLIHIIGPAAGAGTGHPNPEENLLVLCPGCEQSFMNGSVDEIFQHLLARYRQPEVKRAMRDILRTRTRDYTPPGDFDPEASYREMFGCGAPDLCLNGG